MVGSDLKRSKDEHLYWHDVKLELFYCSSNSKEPIGLVSLISGGFSRLDFDLV